MDRESAALQRRAFRSALRTMKHREGLGAPLRDAFYQRPLEDGVAYPLAALMSSRSGPGGGRGGKTRVALYLSLLWVAAGKDYSSKRPASFWAELLGLSDPGHAGSRVVRSTWRELEARGFVSITPGVHDGDVPIVQLRKEDGSGELYTIPAGVGGDTYRRIPQTAFQTLLADPDLTCAGLVMYLVALRTADRAERNEGLVFPKSHIKDEYGIGESTRKSGLRNLAELNYLDAKPERAVDDFGDVSYRRRLRTVYDLLEMYGPQQDHAEQRASSG